MKVHLYHGAEHRRRQVLADQPVDPARITWRAGALVIGLVSEVRELRITLTTRDLRGILAAVFAVLNGGRQ